MNVAFTGTRSGMTENQIDRLWSVLEGIKLMYDNLEFHHGDCIGADEKAHRQAESVEYVIVKHPPKNPKYRAFCKSGFTLPEKEYIERNHDIVDATDILIATPQTIREVIRSGTWATVRYAWKQKKSVIIIYP